MFPVGFFGGESSLECFADTPEIGAELVEEVRLDLIQRAFAECLGEPPATDALSRPVCRADLRDGRRDEARIRGSRTPIAHLCHERTADRVPQSALQMACPA